MATPHHAHPITHQGLDLYETKGNPQYNPGRPLANRRLTTRLPPTLAEYGGATAHIVDAITSDAPNLDPAIEFHRVRTILSGNNNEPRERVLTEIRCADTIAPIGRGSTVAIRHQ
jgi:hypothetical protein